MSARRFGNSKAQKTRFLIASILGLVSLITSTRALASPPKEIEKSFSLCEVLFMQSIPVQFGSETEAERVRENLKTYSSGTPEMTSYVWSPNSERPSEQLWSLGFIFGLNSEFSQNAPLTLMTYSAYQRIAQSNKNGIIRDRGTNLEYTTAVTMGPNMKIMLPQIVSKAKHQDRLLLQASQIDTVAHEVLQYTVYTTSGQVLRSRVIHGFFGAVTTHESEAPLEPLLTYVKRKGLKISQIDIAHTHLLPSFLSGEDFYDYNSLSTEDVWSLLRHSTAHPDAVVSMRAITPQETIFSAFAQNGEIVKF